MAERQQGLAPFLNNTLQSSEPSNLRVIVMGAGPVGIRFVESIFSYLPEAHVLVCSNEPYRPYNRVQLSAFLSGDISREELDIPLPDPDSQNFNFLISTIEDIDRTAKSVTTSDGKVYYYDKLIIATGSKAFTPNITGNHLPGVYTFRNLKDTEALYARIMRARHIVIVGGGLLGCESAKALCKNNTRITLIQQAPHLMNRQLDEEAGGLLQKRLEALGIKVIVNDGVRHIEGESRVEGIETRTKEYIPCDTVLFCTGTSPNTKLALKAKLAVATGITVTEYLQTSDSEIYAIGECCEHSGKTYGLVNPGYEQAAIAANHIAGHTAFYPGSLSVSRLKVVNESVCSIGEVTDLLQRAKLKELIYRDKARGVYRKLVLHKGLLIGALAIGEWPEMPRVQEIFSASRNLSLWQHYLFLLKGHLWLGGQAAEVSQWPSHTLVCQCNAVSRGVLSEAIEQGCQTSLCLQQQTRAGTVCGSCKPLLNQLLGQDNVRTKEWAWISILLASLTALAFVIGNALTPEFTTSDSVQTIPWFERIWNDSFFKQVTGFSLLGLTLIGLMMSLKKRFKLSWIGQFEHWRLVHIILGLLCTVILIFHTGFHFGENLNRLLILNFIAIIVLGATTGFVISLSDKFSPSQSMALKKTWSWLHIIVSWPLPALLAIHILTVYYY